VKSIYLTFNLEDFMNPMTDKDIAEYLVQNPEFFDQHAELLATIRLYGGHGTRAASLHERQAQMLREKIKLHEQRIMEMIRFGNENVTIANRLHEWTKEMLGTTRLDTVPDRVQFGLQSHFFIPQTALRLWNVKANFAQLTVCSPVSENLKAFAETLEAPYTGVNQEWETLKWLTEPETVQSVALIPLHKASTHGRSICFGLILFASPDSQRFTATMGVDFLERIGELASAALAPLTLSDAAPKDETDHRIEPRADI
jgi:uncharacterized protein